LSRHERALAHKDGENCPSVGYTNTGALCGFFFDAKGDHFSLKVLSNSRAKAGSFISNVFQMAPMIARAKRQTEALDHEYKLLVLRQSQNGGHTYPNRLTCRTLHNLEEELLPYTPIVDIIHALIKRLGVVIACKVLLGFLGVGKFRTFPRDYPCLQDCPGFQTVSDPAGS
jgi:hypothetical protein